MKLVMVIINGKSYLVKGADSCDNAIKACLSVEGLEWHTAGNKATCALDDISLLGDPKYTLMFFDTENYTTILVDKYGYAEIEPEELEFKVEYTGDLKELKCRFYNFTRKTTTTKCKIVFKDGEIKESGYDIHWGSIKNPENYRYRLDFKPFSKINFAKIDTIVFYK